MKKLSRQKPIVRYEILKEFRRLFNRLMRSAKYTRRDDVSRTDDKRVHKLAPSSWRARRRRAAVIDRHQTAAWPSRSAPVGASPPDLLTRRRFYRAINNLPQFEQQMDLTRYKYTSRRPRGREFPQTASTPLPPSGTGI